MSFRAAAWAIEEPLVKTANQKLVLILLGDCHNNGTGRCDPSIEYLAKHSRLSRRTVERCIAQLEALGVIRVERRTDDIGMKRSSFYHLNVRDIPRKKGVSTDASESRIGADDQPENPDTTDASQSRIDASESRMDTSSENPSNQPAASGANDASESRNHSGRCVTESRSDASESRINQEYINQEYEPRERRAREGSVPEYAFGRKIYPPVGFFPDELAQRQLKNRHTEADLETMLEAFRCIEFTPPSDWSRRFTQWVLRNGHEYVGKGGTRRNGVDDVMQKFIEGGDA